MRFCYLRSWFEYHVEFVVTHHADDALAIGLIPDARHCFDGAAGTRESTTTTAVTFFSHPANGNYWYPGAFALTNGDRVSFVEQRYARAGGRLRARLAPLRSLACGHPGS